jgi:hypothetical protein
MGRMSELFACALFSTFGTGSAMSGKPWSIFNEEPLHDV